MATNAELQAQVKELQAQVKDLQASFAKVSKWGTKVNARLDALHQADQNKGLEKAMTGKDSSDQMQFPNAFEGLEIPPVPEDYAGEFATWAPDSDKNQMRIVANLDALANPCHTEQYGGEDYNIIPVVSKAGNAGWIAVKADAQTNAMEGRFGVNQGEAVSYIAFDDLLAVRGKQTSIDLEEWEERKKKKEAEAPQYEPANEDPF